MMESMASESCGFVFVLTPLDVKCEVPCELVAGYELARATDEQVELIRRWLSWFEWRDVTRGANPYDSFVLDVYHPNNKNVGHTLVPLPRCSWRYWVINFEGVNGAIDDLAHACELLEHPWALGFSGHWHAIPGMPNFMGPGVPIVTFPMLTGSSYPFLADTKVTSADLVEIRRLFDLIKGLPERADDVRRARRMLYDLRALNESSRFHTIGLVSIIEALLVHHQTKLEVGDSIAHQVKTKMRFLAKRFTRSTDIREWFPTLRLKESDPVSDGWAKLYNYRSKLVHGSSLEDVPNDFIKQPAVVEDFLREVVKCLIIYGLEDWESLALLKAC